MKIPIISHESDLSFGLANKIILHYCTYMCTTFEETGKNNKKCVFTGQPIRENILAKNNENAYNLCLEVKNNFKAMCEIHHADIEIVSNKEETINCDKKWTIEAMNNIVKNAIEHGAKSITIKIEENTIYTKIIIRDNGEGIDKEDLGHIFDRFYKAKNSKESSLGIGLAFCKSIIRNQDGDIRVKSSKKEKDTWTEFTIKLYK